MRGTSHRDCLLDVQIWHHSPHAAGVVPLGVIELGGHAAGLGHSPDLSKGGSGAYDFLKRVLVLLVQRSGSAQDDFERVHVVLVNRRIFQHRNGNGRNEDQFRELILGY